ncbi:hypothetical protein [Sphingopyxis sp. PET50]|uniref:hypothetical protein n=1 Tax=Sphingopyxis sp. PET50 TaxID=2976533 RepID=UPI0021AE8F1C|nr:hypothetical protein [Sphingopyxis sp. PET50]
MATSADGAVRVELFWHRMAIGLAVFIVFGFLQFALRGFVDPVTAPFWVHLHGVAMLSWLALLIAQPTLVSRDNLALHRRLGWVGAGLATIIVALGIFTGIASLALHRFPPFFTPPYFLALTVIESLMFGLVVAWAIRRRRHTDWHRRLMIGATIVILELGARPPAADAVDDRLVGHSGGPHPVARGGHRRAPRPAHARPHPSGDQGDRGACRCDAPHHLSAVDDAPRHRARTAAC